MSKRLSRREMLRNTSLAGVGVWASGRLGLGQGKSPNEKLNIAVVGCGGRGAGNLRGVASQNIVALCDADYRRAAGAFKKYPKVKRFDDYRKMLDEIHRQIDAVVVSTPDHHHAPASMMAMKLGKHVYCEKPLTRTVHEARTMAQTAAKQKVATQMGTQYNSSEGYRRAVETIQSGAIGPVREVHCWTDRAEGWWPQGIGRPADTPPVPEGLNWDVWLGPSPNRPYNPAYVPRNWRGWCDFGTGAMGDMACHICNVVFWALKLGSPASAEAVFSPDDADTLNETFPKWCIITYEFPAREDMPPVKFVWYDGKKKPPAEVSGGIDLGSNGSLFVGKKGKALVSCGGGPALFPKKEFADYKPPEPWLPRRPEIHKDWIHACKTGELAGCHFGYSGPMTEALLVGNVALLAGRKIQWDAANMKATNCPEAEQFVKPPYRTGWTL